MRRRKVKTKTTIRAGIVAAGIGGAVLALPAPAMANHTHVMVVGNGECVVLAEDAGEEAVALPLAVFENNPNVDISPTALRMHPLHVLVHLGRPGENNALFVYGTPAADAACASGIVNR
jgi:hypothetical protein